MNIQAATQQPTKHIIDNEEFEFYRMPALKSANMLTRVLKIIAPAYDSMGKDKASILDLDLAKLFSSETLNPDDIEKIMKEVLSSVYVKGKCLSDIMDVFFKGRIKTMFLVFYKALEVEYSDFLEDINVKANKQEV